MAVYKNWDAPLFAIVFSDIEKRDRVSRPLFFVPIEIYFIFYISLKFNKMLLGQMC